jgi:hypothetical protein
MAINKNYSCTVSLQIIRFTRKTTCLTNTRSTGIEYYCKHSNLSYHQR